MYIVGDIGGTNTRLSNTKDLSTLDQPTVQPTPKDYTLGLQMIKDYADKCSKIEVIEGVCLGISGILAEEKSHLVRSPHLPNWEKKPLQSDLHNAINTNVFLENDTALVGLGESIFGAGKDHDLVAYITVSTGVGGARINEKTIDDKKFGFEPGHQIISVGDELLSLEQIISGTGIQERTGKRPEDIDKDDAIWKDVTKFAAIGLHNTILHWSPDILVLGGGIILSEKLSIHNITEIIQELLVVFPEIPEIKKAELEDFGGLYGAMEHIKSNSK
ncbi:ROK family protein [Candidatus Dojkabacteria bacterium]|uniref:ROK family protein n=1 Tax=Candidatus Dojkabacteria bacterium TaxID=2099670 RepID=A0A955L1T0_9BACT|nr:ROK family protein [Candidatus Dojkabacteria bacterium]